MAYTERKGHHNTIRTFRKLSEGEIEIWNFLMDKRVTVNNNIEEIRKLMNEKYKELNEIQDYIQRFIAIIEKELESSDLEVFDEKAITRIGVNSSNELIMEIFPKEIGG